jgi:serine/threonine protein kinase
MHPEQIGPYRIDRKIGAGGMGNVYHGVHEETGQAAAVKVLPASMAREDGFVQRFNREIVALRQLSNRYIVQLYGNGEYGETWYYAMEFVDGITLTADITERRRIPWQEVIDYSLQIAAALKAAHDAGIIHRDLKPSNLMLTKDHTVKLTDFGVAHVFATTRLTRTGGVVGTAEYMSPEQAQGKRATKRSDLYSLGAVMYVMLTGRPPFTGPTANDILQKHQFGTFDKPTRYAPDCPRLLEDLVCQLLEKDPAKRLPDALVLIRKLEQIKSRIAFSEQHPTPLSICLWCFPLCCFKVPSPPAKGEKVAEGRMRGFSVIRTAFKYLTALEWSQTPGSPAGYQPDFVPDRESGRIRICTKITFTDS